VSRSTNGVLAEDVTHCYEQIQVLRGITVAVSAGEFVTLLGSSGSGKTTLLRIIAGLLTPTAGRVVIADVDVTKFAPEKRGVGLVFQNYALFPHLSVADNITFPLRMRGTSHRETQHRLHWVVQMVGLHGLESRYPAQLSGGQQQRVALARAIVFQPQVLLLDEPLGALDKRLRQHLGDELRDLQRQLGITTVYVTHDQEEAFVLSDRIAVMDNGAIVQFDTPENIYRSPKGLFVARFVGALNEFSGVVADVRADRIVLRTMNGVEVSAKLPPKSSYTRIESSLWNQARAFSYLVPGCESLCAGCTGSQPGFWRELDQGGSRCGGQRPGSCVRR
jgi:ABC-type Fe3+/spermidine/putrescine transport system ATPase subunit